MISTDGKQEGGQMRLIDADALAKKLCKLRCGKEPSECSGFKNYSTYCPYVNLITTASTMDAVCVVRCNDCVYGDSTNGAIFECRKHSKVRESKFGISTMFLERHERGFFCADGERKEDDGTR